MNSLSQIAWSKFKKDVLGVTALCAIILAVVVSIFGYHQVVVQNIGLVRYIWIRLIEKYI